MPSWGLILLFFITAALYAAVGFGGGSTYSSLLVLSGTDYRILPSIALICNILVVSGGLLRFRRAGLLPFRRTLPFLLTSIPAAWLGGRLIIPETLFIGLLGFALLLSGIRLGFQKPYTAPIAGPVQAINPVFPYFIGAGIGFLAGMVGIGGGIFLAPILYFLNWGTARHIAAACSLFIFANSVSGLSGQLTKLADQDMFALLTPYWPLLPAVIIGGQIGSHLATKNLKPAWIKNLTALLILYVALRLLWRWAHIVL